MTRAQSDLVSVLREARALLALPGNDFAWSHWKNEIEALKELDDIIAAIESGTLPERGKVSVLFAPTGSIQEVSINSGWSLEFLALSEKFDHAESRV